MDEVWHRGAGSAHYERLAAPQRCQPTWPFAPGCLGTRDLCSKTPLAFKKAFRTCKFRTPTCPFPGFSKIRKKI
eukprot:scaffold29778_cov62-Phaeocystis_antarctica.AAC.6